MTSSTTKQRPSSAAATAALVPLNFIRTETVLSRLPIHNLSKKGQVQIQITVKNAQGHVDLSWQVFPNPAFGTPRQLASKVRSVPSVAV